MDRRRLAFGNIAVKRRWRTVKCSQVYSDKRELLCGVIDYVVFNNEGCIREPLGNSTLAHPSRTGVGSGAIPLNKCSSATDVASQQRTQRQQQRQKTAKRGGVAKYPEYPA
ncbi:hypothetical protein [Actimicrobium antarcticum]|uniref:Uncharacterized protein n=1 Tax=Actimicrobium antarcticum TaxID=1051899 RepID=A0ABP7TFK9_9BURK